MGLKESPSTNDAIGATRNYSTQEHNLPIALLSKWKIHFFGGTLIIGLYHFLDEPEIVKGYSDVAEM